MRGRRELGHQREKRRHGAADAEARDDAPRCEPLPVWQRSRSCARDGVKDERAEQQRAAAPRVACEARDEAAEEHADEHGAGERAW